MKVSVKRRIKQVLLTTLTVGLIGYIILAFVSIGENNSADGKGTVVCGVGFFYDMEQNPTESTYMNLEEIAAKECTDKKKRDVYNYRQKDKKHAVLVDNACIINWELTTLGHKIAFNNVCKQQ